MQKSYLSVSPLADLAVQNGPKTSWSPQIPGWSDRSGDNGRQRQPEVLLLPKQWRLTSGDVVGVDHAQ